MERTFNFEVPRRSVFSALGLIAIAAFTYWQFANYVIPSLAYIFEVLETERTTTHAETARLMWVPIIGYLLIAGNALLTVQIFKPLKTLSEQGLVRGLVRGLTGGLVLSLVLSLVDTIGLVGGLIGLVAGLVGGLTGGLIGEFKK